MTPHREWIETVAFIAELAGVGVILVGLLLASVRYLLNLRSGGERAYESYRRGMGRAILLGLEVLIAADIITTVTLEPKLSNVLVLAIVVLVRTLLSLSIQVEIDGRFPWQHASRSSRSPDT